MRALRSPHTLVVLVGYGLGIAALCVGFPDQVPSWWSVSGRGTVTGWLGVPTVAFMLPTAMALTDALLRGLCVRHPVDTSGPMDVLAVYDAIMLRVTVFVMGVHATVLLALLGMLRGRGWAGQIVPVMLGLTIISIGNLLPRTRPNLAIGIRTRRTLSDRAVWIQIHRSVGYMVVALGAVLVLSALALPRPIGPGMILAAGPVTLVEICILVLRSSVDARHGSV